MTTFAGTGTFGFSGDGGPATSAKLNQPIGVAVDGSGNLLIVDWFNGRVRRVNASTGIITTVAGNGTIGFSGDGGPATSASLSGATFLTFDSSSDFFISDFNNFRVRRVTPATPTLSSGLLNFGSQAIGTTSASQAITFNNPISSSVTIGSIAVSGDFVLQTASGNPCSNGLSVAAGGSCNIAVAFAPTALYAREGTLTVNDSGAGSPRTAWLTGLGVGPSLSPPAWDFGAQTVATVSLAKVFTYTNQSSSNFHVASISTGSAEFIAQGSGGFPCFNGQFMSQGATCALSLTFTPSNTGVRTGTLTIITDNNAVQGPRTASLSGTGVVAATNPAPVLASLSPAGAVVGLSGLTVTISGSGFISSSLMAWNGSVRSTSYVTATTLTATITQADLANVGSANVTVINSAPGGGTSNALPFVIAPAITGNPASAQPVLQTPTSRIVSTTSAPASALTPPCGNGSVSNAVWLSYTAAANGTLTADSTGSSYKTIISAYTGSTTNLNNVGCAAAPSGSAARDAVALLPAPATLALPVTGGITYFFLLTAANGDGGTLHFNLSFTSSAQVPTSAFVTMLPHMVTGGGYITKLTLVNMSGPTNNVVVNFLGQAGSIQSTQTILMQAAQTVRIATPESSRNLTQTIQWVTVGGGGRVGVNLFFEVADQAGTVFNCQSRRSRWRTTSAPSRPSR
jgi:hypothetical protein